MDLSTAKRRRTLQTKKFVRLEATLSKSLNEDHVERTLISRFNELKEAWETLQERHEEYVSLMDDESAIDTEEKVITDYADQFYELQSRVDAKIEQKEQIRKESEAHKLRDLEFHDAQTKYEKECKEKCIEVYSIRDQEGAKFKLLHNNINELLHKDIQDSEKHHVTDALKSALVDMENLMDSCNMVNKEYTTLYKRANPDEEVLDWITPLCDMYNRIRLDAKIFISRYTPPAISDVAADVINPTSTGIRLDKMKVATFEGSIRRYPQFKADFTKHVKPLCGHGQEAFILRSHLQEDIRDEVISMGDDVEAIWDFLDKRYGSKRKLIDAILSDIKASVVYEDHDKESLLEFIKVVEKAHRDLEKMGMESEIENSTIVGIIEQHLPSNLREEWVKIAIKCNKEGSGDALFSSLLEYLKEIKDRIDYDRSAVRLDSTPKVPQFPSNNIRENKSNGNSNEDFKKKCFIHQSTNGHPIWRCRTFLGMTPTERLDAVIRHNACQGCLGIGHETSKCPRDFKCSVDNCGRPHHRLIHDAVISADVTVNNSPKGAIDLSREGDTLLQLQSVEGGKRGGNKCALNVLWDPGSTISLITFNRARQLKLSGKRQMIELVKVGDVIERIESYCYELSLKTKDNVLVYIYVYGIERISSDIKAVNLDNVRQLIPDYDWNEIERPDKGQIDCLIGFNYAAFHPIRQRALDHFLILKNQFGSIIGGSHPLLKEKTKTFVQHATVLKIAARIDDFYKIENLGIECNPKCGGCKCGTCHIGGKSMSLKEERELKLIEENMVYCQNNKQWTIGYPWIKDPTLPPDNKGAVFSKLRSTEKRLLKNPSHANAYDSEIKAMVDRSAARLLTECEEKNYSGPSFYISHHAVIKPESKSTPCRIVFNTSANYHGHTLNDYYAKGPDMLNNLLAVLLRFRENHVAYVGDVSKMFHSIAIPKIDQMTHKFLWRNIEVNRKPETYVMTAVNMGDRPSATMAMLALQKTAKMQKSQYPYAAKAIIENSYMDDILDSVDNHELALQVIKEMETILQEGGFKIKEWITSNNGENEAVYSNEKEIIQPAFSKEDDNKHQRVLGMNWNPDTDIFTYKTIARRMYENEEWTKRKILSTVNGIYDPLGLLTPYTIRAKIILRKLWVHEPKLEWDDPIPDTILNEWLAFVSELPHLSKLAFKRCVKPNFATEPPTLVVFSDGSNDAYGTAAYIRWKIADGRYEANLIAAKNRIAPAKTIDIVRLELAGAVLGKRLRTFIEENSRLEFESIYHIVDSEIVQAMIPKESYGFNTFVANRIGEIQEKTDKKEWMWVPGKLNIADWTTRGKSPAEMDLDSEWQRGPDFLQKPLQDWPIKAEITLKDLPERKVADNGT